MLAIRLTRTAKMFAGVNDEGVVFVEKGNVVRKTAFEERANLFVGGARMDELVAVEYAAGVGVDDEDFVLSGVEKDGVGGLWPDAVHG